MGSFFSKKQKPKELSFEQIERMIEALDPKSYPSFDKSFDWSKTMHVYSSHLCVKEKYVSYSLIGILFLFFIFCSFWGFRNSENPISDFGDAVIEEHGVVPSEK